MRNSGNLKVKDGKLILPLPMGEVSAELTERVHTPSGTTCHLPKRGRKCAFTLAEVLITLGVIGVVAAMTMPNLIKNYENQVKLNKLKKFYSQFEQLILRSVDENDSIMSWSEEDLQNGNSDKILEQYIFPYLDNPKICKSTAGLCFYKNNLVYNTRRNNNKVHWLIRRTVQLISKILDYDLLLLFYKYYIYFLMIHAHIVYIH